MAEDGKAKQRNFIYKELLQTEKDYINNLERLLWFHHEMTDPEELPDLRPLSKGSAMLRHSAHYFFSNAEDIAIFHSETLLPEFESCEDDPTEIGQVFIEWKEELIALYTIYAQYCDARIALLDQIGDKNKFLVAAYEKQQKLGMPGKTLNAYTMTPMQRITGKYEMLLMDMKKNTVDDEKKGNLEKAIEAMRSVTKEVNGVQFCPLITEYPGKDIHLLGRLIMQGEFKMAERDRGVFSDRTVIRYVLMFEKAILITAEQVFTHKEATLALKKGAHEKKLSTKKKTDAKREDAARSYKLYVFKDKRVLGFFGVAPYGSKLRKSKKVYKMTGPSDEVKLKWAEEMFKLQTGGRVKLGAPVDTSQYVDEGDN